jgi:hypothetical protein
MKRYIGRKALVTLIIKTGMKNPMSHLIHFLGAQTQERDWEIQKQY